MSVNFMASHSDTAVFNSSQTQSLWANANPIRMIGDLFAKRQLLKQFILREVQGRYRGSYLGIFWAVITPLLMLAVYTFVFAVVFGNRWGESSSKMAYALNIFGGIIVFSVFSESASRAPMLIVGNPNFVKKVVFPLELLPASVVGSALIHSLLSLVIAVIAVGATSGLSYTLIYLPLVFVPLIGLTLGVSWFLASLGVFIRDIGNLISVLLSLLFFLTPITYPMRFLDDMPTARRLYWLNPLTTIVDSFRRVLNEGLAPQWMPLLLVTLFTWLIAVLGYTWFMKIKRAFADVI